MTYSRDAIVSFLKQDYLKNINMLNFIEAYPIHSLERIGNSVLLRGDSDCRWVYISSPDEEELRAAASRLAESDRTFAAIEEWMVPLLVRDRVVAWQLSMMRLVLPPDVGFAEGATPVVPLSPDHADYIFEHSVYQNVTRPDFIRKRIQDGPGAGVCESGKLVAWLMTQDDGSIGLLHVLDNHRGRSYAYDLTLYLIGKLRERGKLPFVHVEETNTSSMNLALKVGFRKDRRLHWFKLPPPGSTPATGDYC